MNWANVHWNNPNDQQAFSRIITGKAKVVRVPITVLWKVYQESATFRAWADESISLSRALRFLIESDGELKKPPGMGRAAVDGRSLGVRINNT